MEGDRDIKFVKFMYWRAGECTKKRRPEGRYIEIYFLNYCGTMKCGKTKLGTELQLERNIRKKFKD